MTRLPEPAVCSSRPAYRVRRACVVATAATLLAACGGGGNSDDGGAVSDQNAEGYAADAATMPVMAGTTASAATVTLQSAVAAATAAPAKPAAEGATLESGSGEARALASTGTNVVPCALGGTVSWVASGPALDLLLNRRLDAGETYDVSYNNCATAITGVVLNGTVQVVVNAADTTGFDLSTTATGLTATTAQGRFVLNGSWQHQLRVTGTANGGTERVNRLVTPLATLDSTVGTRQARYELRQMDWTATDLWNGSGALVSRSHDGALTLFASTPRRPSATLQVATLGTLVIGADGLATSGGFSLVIGGDKWSVSYGATAVTIELDIGNNGSVERTWVVQRLFFHGEAG
ncbi:MAG: hypothetical protein KIT17_20975 [Rubrivivax sp.]|nr:hypothetical protein [Rubrivivax sp.]